VRAVAALLNRERWHPCRHLGCKWHVARKKQQDAGRDASAPRGGVRFQRVLGINVLGLGGDTLKGGQRTARPTSRRVARGSQVDKNAAGTIVSPIADPQAMDWAATLRGARPARCTRHGLKN